MNFNYFAVDLSGWKNTGEMSWFIEYECPSCPKMYRGEVAIGMYSPGIEEAPVFAQISQGFFLIRQSPATVEYPLNQDGIETIDKVKEVVANNMGQMIMSHFAEEPEVHSISSFGDEKTEHREM